MRACQKTCDREPRGLPAHGTRTDWSEMILPESQRSGAAALRPAREEEARISQAVWTSPVRSERSFHDKRGCWLPMPTGFERCSQARAYTLTGERFSARTEPSTHNAAKRENNRRDMEFIWCFRV